MPPDLLQSAMQALTKLDLTFIHAPESDDLNTLAKVFSESLQELHLYCSHMRREAYSAVAEFHELRYLELDAAQTLEDGSLAQIIRNIPHLETLEMGQCLEVSDDGFALIPNLKGLRSLNLFYCHISREGFRGLATIKTLQSLDLRATLVDLRAIQYLSCLQDLRILKLPGCSSKSFRIICENFKKLECLGLFCTTLTHSDGRELRHLKHLKKCDFHNCFGFNDSTFEEGLQTTALENLTIIGSPLTDAGLATLAANHGRLRKLHLEKCANITDVGLVNLLRCENFLRKLYLNSCGSLTDATLRELSEDICPRLERLELERCSFSARSVRLLVRRRPLLFVERRHCME